MLPCQRKGPKNVLYGTRKQIKSKKKRIHMKMYFVYNTANEKITLDVDMTPEEYQKAAKRFVDQFEITFGHSLDSECKARLSHCDLDALTGIPYGKRQ